LHFIVEQLSQLFIESHARFASETIGTIVLQSPHQKPRISRRKNAIQRCPFGALRATSFYKLAIRRQRKTNQKQCRPRRSGIAAGENSGLPERRCACSGLLGYSAARRGGRMPPIPIGDVESAY
jgi:hypothetical protein